MSEWSAVSELNLKSDFPLHRACRDGDSKTLSLIIKEHSEESKKHIVKEDRDYGWTPMHWAAYFGKLDCIRVIVMQGPINGKSSTELQTTNFKQTPTHIAAFAGHSHCLNWLIQAGSNIHAQDYLGESPLHKASRSGSLECVSLLVNIKADVNLKNHSEQHAGHLAESAGYPEVAKYLSNFILKPDVQNRYISVVGYYGFQPPKPTVEIKDECEMEMDSEDASTPPTNGHSLVTNAQTLGTNGQSFGTNGHSFGTNGHSFGTNGQSFGTNGHPFGTNGHSFGTNGVSKTPTSNGKTKEAITVKGDITLNMEVVQNRVAIGGKKRSREEYSVPIVSNEMKNKRIRMQGPVKPLIRNANNKTSTTPGNNCSMSEHYQSVLVEKGYDSVSYQIMMQDAHGC